MGPILNINSKNAVVATDVICISSVIEELVSYTGGKSLPEEQKLLINKAFDYHSLKRKRFHLYEGQTCNSLTYVIQGSLKMYSVNTDGREHVINIFTEGSWVHDPESYYQNKPSQYYIEALEDCQLFTGSRNKIQATSSAVPAFEAYLESMYDNHLNCFQARMQANISQTATERIMALMATRPEAIMRFPQIVIASFLGIKPETLSRIRKQLLGRRVNTTS